MAVGVIADKMSDLSTRIETLANQAGQAESAGDSANGAGVVALAERLEAVADRLESP